MQSFLRKAVEHLQPMLKVLLAWLFLNILMNIKYPAEQGHAFTYLLFSPEVLMLLALLSFAVYAGMPFHPVFYLPLTALVIFLRLFRIGDILVPMYFYRPFNLFLDSRFLPDLIHLLYNTFSLKTFIFFSSLAVTMLVGTIWGVWQAFKTIHHYLAPKRRRCVALVLMVGILLLLSYLDTGGINHRPSIVANGFYQRVVEEFDFILHVQGLRNQHLRFIQAGIEKAEQIPSSLDKLNRTNVYFIFVESYGHTVFAHSRHSSKIEPVLVAFEKDLRKRGFAICSNFLKSTAYGGYSWLPYATLSSGVHLDNQMRYNLLITSKAKTIARYFNAAEYKTISVMPGTRWPWPGDDFFGYQKKYYAWDFDYRGPAYGWSPMPDQYVLDFIHRKEIKNRTQPIFVMFALVSSHAPFHLQPPFLEDWLQIGTGAIYHEKEAITFPVIWPDLSNASEAYITAIIYDLNVIKVFIERYVTDNTLIIVLGDHQPNVQITGKNQPWSVPIHVISKNRRFLKPFEKRGYTPGIIPREPMPHRGMETFLYEFLSDFSTPKSRTMRPIYITSPGDTPPRQYHFPRFSLE